jgi:flagellar biosynthesis protein FliQ
VTTNFEDLIKLLILLGVAPLLPVLFVGVLVGFLQTVTQIQEQTIAFVARIATLIIIIWIVGDFAWGSLVDFTTESYLNLVNAR